MIYKILHKSELEPFLRSGSLHQPSLEEEGFLHCSTLDQVLGVANTIYKGKADLLLLELDETRIAPMVQYDKASNGEAYPHIYGPLNADAMVRFLDFPVQADGSFILPDLD